MEYLKGVSEERVGGRLYRVDRLNLGSPLKLVASVQTELPLSPRASNQGQETGSNSLYDASFFKLSVPILKRFVGIGATFFSSLIELKHSFTM